ncbi:hypothetical protein T265_06448 [Opisthorchis viverrini]|uniref:MAM domain-containing protein n=1 Tax=Opisthorchis viverrini TaxID=6198 RepID=A0A074ZG48_OPIVI|nr:hypothetical protein T265_06448 [Opisthorchis viverrini]KER26251.1 hypothetical protein T265_06448 [Opisthorchis viverrini]
MCGWNNDLNSWNYRWTLAREPSAAASSPRLYPSSVNESYCCFSVKQTEMALNSPVMTDDYSAWLVTPRPARVQLPQTMDSESVLQSRLWSPAIPGTMQLKCLAFSFHIKLGRAIKEKLPVDPIHVCSFQSDTCGWTNDPNSWKHRWELDRLSVDDDQALCLSSVSKFSSGPISMASPWDFASDEMEANRPAHSGPIQARLWSPPIQKRHKLGCLTVLYQIHGSPATAIVDGTQKPDASLDRLGLALLRRQEGFTVNVSFLFSEITPIHVCTFASDTCGWTNDQNSWKHRWELDPISFGKNQALCLSSVSQVPTSVALPWAVSADEAVLDALHHSSPIQGRLWSPPIQKRHKLGCFAFLYRIDSKSHIVSGIQGTEQSDPLPGLAVLSRQEG